VYILCEKKVGAKLLKVVAEFPFPDLSVHVETDVAFAGSLPFPFRSVASNHKAHPEMRVGFHELIIALDTPDTEAGDNEGIAVL
jgi:hypothetical protein